MQKTLYLQIDTIIDDTVECEKLIKRGDTLIMQIKVFTNGILADLTGQLADFIFKKADNTLIQWSIVNITNSIITVVLDVQATNVIGVVSGEIQLRDSNGQTSTNTFTFNVSEAVANDVLIASQNDIQVINDIRALLLTFEDEVLAFGESTTATEALNNIKQYLDSKLPILISENNEAVTNIATGVATKSNLDLSISNANEIKSEVDASKISANITKDELITTIANADTKLQEFKDYDTTELVPLSNTMLNNMYCNQELLSINHNLNGYPIVKLTYTEYGAGIGGAGDFPAGADSDCNLMQNKTVYTDNNNLIIYVPENYYIENPEVNKVDDYKYVVTFLNSTRSILINLIRENIEEEIELKVNTEQISNPNLLINGDFQIWQRGTIFTNNANKYTSDRWMVKTIDDSTVFTQDLNSMKITLGENIAGYGGISQFLEKSNFQGLIGKTLTLSFEIKASQNINGIFRCQATDRDVLEFGSLVYDITTSYSKVKLDFILSQITNNIEISPFMNNVSNAITDLNGVNVWIKNVKLEIGSIATPFSPKLIGEEILSCKRYFIPSLRANGYAFETNKLSVELNIPSMRVIPTITTSEIYIQGGNQVETGLISYGGNTENLIDELYTINTNFTVGLLYKIVFNSIDAEIY